jgi:DNA-binding transcriptional ArsR family regulator
MKPRVPLLSPLLRSDTQGVMLAQLYLFPERERTASELARDAGVSLPTVLRELDRLTTAGFLRERTSGRNRYLRANTDHPLFRPVVQILQYSYGPIALLPELLSGIERVDQAFVYGSWAARFTGEEGADPNDIDVLVVGNPDRGALFDVAQRATALLHREVNIRGVSAAQWEASDDLFLRTLRDRPLVPIPLHEGASA